MKRTQTVLQEIYDRVAKETNLSSKEVKLIYEAYWLYIKTQIQSLPLKEDITEEEFNKLQLNYRVRGLGTLFCMYSYRKLKFVKNIIDNATNKSNKTAV